MKPEELKNLQRGDIVRHKSSASACVIERNRGAEAIGVRTYSITNPDEWLLVKVRDPDVNGSEDYRKTRAWDELEKAVASCDHGIIVTIQHMRELLAPPKQKSKLERLKDLAHKKAINMFSIDTVTAVVPLNDLLQEIDRLEAEDE